MWPLATSLRIAVGPGCAARIMTGAPLPAGANAVIPVEDTNEAWRGDDRPLPESIQIFRTVNAGDYVRRAGDDIFGRDNGDTGR